MSEEERGFEVIDKRRVSADEPREADPGAGPAAARPGAEAPESSPGAPAEPATEPQSAVTGEGFPGGGPEGPLPEMDAESVVSLCINMLHEVAWVKMGLVPSPTSGKIERDLAQSRLAIDCVADLARHLESRVDERDRRELQNLVSTLRLNFVQQSQR